MCGGLFYGVFHPNQLWGCSNPWSLHPKRDCPEAGLNRCLTLLLPIPCLAYLLFCLSLGVQEAAIHLTVPPKVVPCHYVAQIVGLNLPLGSVASALSFAYTHLLLVWSMATFTLASMTRSPALLPSWWKVGRVYYPCVGTWIPIFPVKV